MVNGDASRIQEGLYGEEKKNKSQKKPNVTRVCAVRVEFGLTAGVSPNGTEF
jgi:hypothetical protein